MGKVIIQPTIRTFNDYKIYADKNGFHFEIVDFAYPNANSLNLIKEYKKKLKGNTKKLSMHGSFLDIYINSPTETIRKASEKIILENLSVAKKLGIKSAIFHTNSLPMMGREKYYENWVNSHTVFWKNTMKKFDITILLENMWDKSPKLIKQVIKNVESKKLRVCFDTGHCNIFSEVSMEEWFKEVGSLIECIHLNDNLGKIDNELPLGEGNIDWKKFDDYVKKYCNKPNVVLEHGSLKDIEKSIQFLKKHKIYPY